MNKRVTGLAALCVIAAYGFRVDNGRIHFSSSVQENDSAMYAYGWARAKMHKYVLPTSEWRASNIVTGVYLGDIYDAHNVPAMKQHNITRILTIARGVEPSYPEDFTYLHLNKRDSVCETLSSEFPKTGLFISRKQAKDGRDDDGAVLVHCMRGASRSATLVVAYLMEHHGMSKDEALAFAKERRSRVNPNETFLKELDIWEHTLEERRRDASSGA